jgi:hypothetical protein
MAAALVLDMTMEDLQILVIGHVDRDEVDAILWDPMPGGSGLLDQICGRFADVVAAAKAIVRDCPSACESSCIDCLQTFRNGFYHTHLDRKLAAEKLNAWGDPSETCPLHPSKAALTATSRGHASGQRSRTPPAASAAGCWLRRGHSRRTDSSRSGDWHHHA